MVTLRSDQFTVAVCSRSGSFFDIVNIKQVQNKN
jgi:hypothetical protein